MSLRKKMADKTVLREIAEELHKPARRNYARRPTVVKGFKDLFQADLVEMQPYANMNQNNRYMLTVIDVFSKYAWAEPLKDKKAITVANAMQNILDSKDGHIFKPPRYLQTDQGKEFYNDTFKNMLKNYNIKLYSTFSNKKAAVIERFNRTLKGKMWREFSVNGSFKWIDILNDLLKEYNNSIHRTIKMKPAEVTSNDEQFLLSIFNLNKNKCPRGNAKKFKVGDCVRISKLKGVFEKGYTANWSAELFTIDKVLSTTPVTYQLRDFKGDRLEGGFYNEELLKAKYCDVYLVEKIVKTRGNKCLVKWYGFPSSENTWEDRKNLTF